MAVDATWLLLTKVYVVVMTLTTLVVTLGLVYLGRKLARLLDTVTKGAQPVISHMQQASRAINDTAQSVSQRAQRAAEVAETKVAQAASELEAASESIKKAAAGPAGSIGALLTGLGQGLLGGAHKEGREQK